MRKELEEKVKTSIERLKAFEPKEGYYLAFSGGKDSVVCKALCDMAGVKYDAHYRVVTVDPPELVRFIKEQHPDVEFEYPRDKNGKVLTMWNLIPNKLMPPTMIVRYCCQALKEGGGDGRMTITGVRWDESTNRKKNQGMVTVMAQGKNLDKLFESKEEFSSTKRGGYILVNDNDESRRMIESCYKRHKTSVNPIIEWTDRDVWEFIREYNIPYCKLYDEGFHRIGCVGCPMAKKNDRIAQLRRWPKYRDAYLRAFEAMQRERERRGKWPFYADVDPSPEGVMRWWLDIDVMPNQINLFEELEDEEDE